MPAEITIKGKRAKRGERMTHGSWRLVKKKRVFAGTLLWTFNSGSKRLAVFSVPK